jgi:hypothetical protein
MAVHGPFSFDISFVKIGQEIKLLEHLNFFFDHPVLCEFGTAISKRYAFFCCLFKIIMSGLLCLITMNAVKTFWCITIKWLCIL